MPSHVTRRQRATRSHRHLLVTVRYTRDDRDTRNGLHLSATRHTRNGGDLRVSSADGYTRTFDTGLRPITVSQTLTNDAQSIDLEFAWPHPQIDPHGIDWIGASVEVSAAYESGDAMEAWELREVLLVGVVTQADIDALDTTMRLGVTAEALEDVGDIYAPDAEVSAVRFPDVNNSPDSDSRNRAYQSMRLLPPIPFCRNGGALESPLSVVTDETPANGTDALIPRRYLVSYVPIASEASVRDVMLLKPDRQPEYYVPSSLIQCAINTGVDSVGDSYRYIDAPMALTFGNSSNTTFVNSADSVYAAKRTGYVHQGDAVKLVIDGDQHYATVTSVDGVDLSLSSGYTGTSGSGAASVIKLPADTEYPAYLLIGQDGGGTSVNGAPVSTAASVAAYIMGSTRIDGVVSLPELRGLTSATLTLDVELVVTKRQSPLAFLSDTLFQWVPFRIYRDGAYLRCYDRVLWHHQSHPSLTVSDGTVGAECVRRSEYATQGDYAKPRVLKYKWSSRLGRSTRVLNIQGVNSDAKLGRMIRLNQQRLGQQRVPLDSVQQVETHEIAEIADSDVACVAEALHLVTEGSPVYRVSLELAPCLWWLRCGDTLTLSDSTVSRVADGDRVWRVTRVERGVRDVVEVTEVTR